MPQSLNQASVKDMDTAFGKFSRARICLNHTNRVQQWTKQINHIEDRSLKLRLSHINRAQHQHLGRSEATRRRLTDNVDRFRAVQQVFRQYTMTDISGLVRGGDFEVAVSKFVDNEVSKKLDSHNRAKKHQNRIRRHYERSRDDFNHTLGRLTSLDLTIKSPPLIRRSDVVQADKALENRRNLDNFSLPYLMLNPMLVTQELDSELEGLNEEQIVELEKKRHERFKDNLQNAYDIDVRNSPSKPHRQDRHMVDKRLSNTTSIH